MDDRTRKLLALALMMQVITAFTVVLTCVHLARTRDRDICRMKRKRMQVYYRRRRARRDATKHPRELLASSTSLPGESVEPRSLVNVRLEHRMPIATTWQSVLMLQWTNEEYIENFRLPKHVFTWLLQRLKPALSYGNASHGGKRPTPPWALLGATLCWLGGGRPADFREKFGMRESAFKKRRWLVISAIVGELAGSFVRFPETPDEFRHISERMSRWCKFEGAIGALDGLIVRVKTTCKELKKVMRCDRHDCTGVNLQAIVDGDDTFTWISSGKYGAVGDGRAFRDTELFEKLENGALTCGGACAVGDYFILADNAYPLRSFLLHPFKGSHAPGSTEDSWNLRMSVARASIERAFAQLVLAFQILKHGINVVDINKAHQVIQAAVILHNVRKRFNAPSLNRASAPNFQRDIMQAGTPLNNEEEAIFFVRHMGMDQVGERRPEDRRAAAQICARIGAEVRERIGQQLVDSGYVR